MPEPDELDLQDAESPPTMEIMAYRQRALLRRVHSLELKVKDMGRERAELLWMVRHSGFDVYEGREDERPHSGNLV